MHVELWISQWLDLTVPGCTWLYLAVLGCNWLYLAIPDCIRLHRAVYGCTRLYPAVPGCTQMHPTVPSYTRLYMAAHGFTWLYLALPCCNWLYLALHYWTWLYLTVDVLMMMTNWEISFTFKIQNVPPSKRLTDYTEKIQLKIHFKKYTWKHTMSKSIPNNTLQWSVVTDLYWLTGVGARDATTSKKQMFSGNWRKIMTFIISYMTVVVVMLLFACSRWSYSRFRQHVCQRLHRNKWLEDGDYETNLRRELLNKNTQLFIWPKWN